MFLEFSPVSRVMLSHFHLLKVESFSLKIHFSGSGSAGRSGDFHKQLGGRTWDDIQLNLKCDVETSSALR